MGAGLARTRRTFDFPAFTQSKTHIKSLCLLSSRDLIIIMYFSNKILQKWSLHYCIIYMQFTELTLPGPHFQGKPFVLCLGKAEPGESQLNKLVSNRIIRAESGDKLPEYSWPQPLVHHRPTRALFFWATQQTELAALKILLTGR